MEDEILLELLAKYIHDLWCEIKSFAIESGELVDSECKNENYIKDLRIPSYKLSEWIEQIDADWESDLSKEEKWTDFREAERIIKLLKDNGYLITKE